MKKILDKNMTGGCSNSCTRAEDVVDSGNIFSGRTKERVATSNISRNILSGHSNKGLIKGCSRTTDGIQTRPTPALSTVAQIRKSRSQIRPSRPDENLVHGLKADVKQIGDRLSKQFQYSVTSSEPKLSSRNLPVVPKKRGVEIPSIRSSYNSPKKEKSSDPLQAQKIIVKSLPVKSPVNTSTARNSRRTSSENHHDKSREAQPRTTTRSNDSSALQRKMNQVEKNSHVSGSTRNQTTKVPSHVEGEKFKSTPIASQSKSLTSRSVKTSKSKENQGKQLKDNVVIAQELMHRSDFGSEFLVQNTARSDFSEDSDDTLGIICPLCENDLACLPPNYEYSDEFESSNLPEVAVLHCGHAFHSTCLEDIVPPHEQCRDPPCYFCL